jgi:hypothetical protein
MIIVSESAVELKRFLGQSGLIFSHQLMVMRMVLGFMMHRGRMSCSAAAGSLASDPIHRGELTRFLARPRWRKHDFNQPLMRALLARERCRGEFMFLLDATLVSQAGRKTQNTYSTGNRGRHPAKGRRYGKHKIVYKKVHGFTFGLLITPSGIRIPMQIPHYTDDYSQARGITQLTTAEAAAQLVRTLALPAKAKVVVIGDTAYESAVVCQACEALGYTWIFPANPGRVYAGKKGEREPLRSRLKDWERLSQTRIRLRASTGKYAKYRRLSRWRVGPKLKERVFYAHQEKREVRNVGYVQLVFSTKNANLEHETPDNVKILMTNALDRSPNEVIELYSLRWQIELFFKELKSTLGFDQYSFHDFQAVVAWVECAITTVLYLEHERLRHMQDRRLPPKQRRWWDMQRLHGLCHAFRQQCAANELKYLARQLKTRHGVEKLHRVLTAAIPREYQAA